MLLQILRRGLLRGLQNVLRQQGWAMSLGSLFGVLFLGQIIVLLTFGAHAGLTLVKEQTDLRLEILDSATDIQIQDLYQNIRQLPYVSDVIYITREQAYERQKNRDPELTGFLTRFGIENPFPETLGVRLRNLEDYPEFVRFLKQPVFTKVVNPSFLSETTDQERQVAKIAEAAVTVRSLLLLIVGLLVMVILFVVVELVRRRAAAKREELFVEQLVGADRFTIFLPFCTEMFCLLSLALIISAGFAAMVIYFMPSFLPVLAFGGAFGIWFQAVSALLAASLGWLLPLELGVILIVALLGTFIALKSQVEMAALPLLSHN
ncbi:hypothetical protein A3J34_02280 [Candidatus Peribacteria bacterium RIFCSPLOWO2_02_FULL_51_10]|nr:MAG: hypothetical protein A3J34_02280 [Candidatus Peribacteria bacterium RIFCSPLOWO2_02_FULL_51_10]